MFRLAIALNASVLETVNHLVQIKTIPQDPLSD
jgi:hypothetical protein